MSSIKSNQNLMREIVGSYKRNVKKLLDIQASTVISFNQIIDILKPEANDLLECINIENLLNISNEFGINTSAVSIDLAISALKYNKDLKNSINSEETQVETENPTIAIIGNVKAGKSTLINVLLRKNVVCQAYERCTARLTRLTYSEKNFVDFIDGNGNLLERKFLKKKPIPKYMVHLKDEERNNLSEVSKIIKAGIKSKILECGIDIIDTPGLNENYTLNNLSKNMIQSILPMMIYVIDSRTSVKQTDITNLIELKNKIPNVKIVFFITKLDTDDVTELCDQNPIKAAEFKMELAFNKLQYNNFISTKFKHFSECKYFHGASLYAYMDYYKKIRTPETEFHFKLFTKFESDLNDILSESFESKICNFNQRIIGFQMDVLTKIISRAKQLVDVNNENLDEIFTMRKIEEKLFYEMIFIITNSKPRLIKLLIDRLNNKSQSIINLIANIEYPSSITIPENANIDNKLVIKCQNFIVDVICQNLENIIEKFVEEELFENYENAFNTHLSSKVLNKIKSYHTQTTSKSPYRLCLERNLVENYKYQSGRSISRSDLNYSILKSMKMFFINLFRIDSCKTDNLVSSSDWKIQQANDILKRCDKDLLADNSFDGLLSDLKIKHDRFLTNLEKEFIAVQKDINLSETIRNKISDETCEFTYLLLKSLDVQSRFLMKNAVEKEIIGQGSQGIVYRCICNKNEYAKKKVILPTDFLQQISEEVYYSYLFEHPNLLPLVAVTIDSSNKFDCVEVSIYSPLMKTDLENYLKNYQISLEEKLKISLQVAEAIKYIHNQNIMHRDLKMANILLDDKNNVYLADYGFCKSLALTNHSFVGTPVHIAPEIVKQSKYDYKVDIYSFGMLLWYLAKGTGEQPRIVTFQSTTAKLLSEMANNDQRPEYLENIPEGLWDLMNKCWDKNPSARPNINNVIQSIQNLISEISSY